MSWKCVLELDTNRNKVTGSEADLADAIRSAADLRILTHFRHNEHIDTSSDSPELIHEVAEFAITLLVDNSWSGGIMSQRQPVDLPVGFGSRPSMSLFLYNQNGQQAIARPFLDGSPATGTIGISARHVDHSKDMPRYHPQTAFDEDTNAPSSNFIYDFDLYRFNVSDTWQELFSHDAGGNVLSGSAAAVGEAFVEGRAVKVAIRGFCGELATDDDEALDNELFVQCGSCYYYTEQELFIAGTHPLARVAPGKPMLYASRNWDYGWLMVRTDGYARYRRCNPYTLEFEDLPGRYAMRWFVR